MERVEETYCLVRIAEEHFGPPVKKGDRLIYRGNSRFPWFDPIFDTSPGKVCEVLEVETESVNTDLRDNRYHYYLKGLEEHKGINTTEVVALFDLERGNIKLEIIALQIFRFIKALDEHLFL